MNRPRINPWRWLRQLESVMVHHMTEFDRQRKRNEEQARLNKVTNTLLSAQTAAITKLHERVSTLESAGRADSVVRIFPGPYSDHGKEQC